MEPMFNYHYYCFFITFNFFISQSLGLILVLQTKAVKMVQNFYGPDAHTVAAPCFRTHWYFAAYLCNVFRVYVVNHRMPRGLFGWLLFYFMWPFRFTFGTLWSIFGFASKIINIY